MAQDQFLSLKDVVRITGLSKTSVYQYAKDGLMPGPIPMGAGASRWSELELQKWMADRIKERDQRLDEYGQPDDGH